MKIVYWKGFRTYIGLMFRFPKKDTIYILDLGKEKNIGAHTMFCLTSLDMYFLDENLNIVRYYKNVKPFRIINMKEKFRYLIEGREIEEKDIEEVKNYLKSINLVK